jgi:hypothetical protein
MPLNYLRDDYHKQAVTHIWESRWFESLYTLQGKTWPTCHTLSTLSPHMVYDHMYFTRSTYSNLSYSHQQIWTDPLHPRRRAPDTIHSTPAVRSIPSFSPTTANGVVGKSQASVDNWLLGLLGPYHRYAIGTFNTCSLGATERSLIDTGAGYNLGGASLPCTHSSTFPTSCIPFPLVTPPGLHFNQVPLIKPRCCV